ncbi:MAG TPA: hypothetical protein VFJ58_25955 [Armatimonadota bacterium]|nr:hypothetical protein [Armatimonadota bacterium]
MTTIAAVMVAFMAGLFIGQELLHRPRIVVAPAPPASMAAPTDPNTAGADTDPASIGSQPPSAKETAALKDAINKENDPQRLAELAEFHVDQQPDIAVLAFQKAIRLGARTAPVYRGLAVAYLGLGEMDRAQKNLRIALRLDPKDIAAHVALALALQKSPSGEKEARAEFKKALQLNPPASLKANIESALKRMG